MVQCPNPTISHGQEINVKDAKYTFGRQAAFQCDPGYVLWGSRRAQCGSDGTWSPPVPFCDKGESGRCLLGVELGTASP